MVVIAGLSNPIGSRHEFAFSLLAAVLSGRTRICRTCRRLPREKRDAVLHEREILGLLEQSHISTKNLARLGVLGRSKNNRIAVLAQLVIDVAPPRPTGASGSASWRGNVGMFCTGRGTPIFVRCQRLARIRAIGPRHKCST
jgi:hypothetical protein